MKVSLSQRKKNLLEMVKGPQSLCVKKGDLVEVEALNLKGPSLVFKNMSEF